MLRGTPALTSRGMEESEMEYLAELIVKALDNPENSLVKAGIREDVKELCSKFPLYPDMEVQG